MAEQLVLLQEEKPRLKALGVERERIESRFRPIMREELRLGGLVSYVGNKSVPILRLYKYKEAFAYGLVSEFIQRFKLTPQDYLFDPFAGMGTTMFAAMLKGIPSIGIDKLPVAVFVAQTLPKFLFLEINLESTYQELRELVDNSPPAPVALDVPIMHKAFDHENLTRLRQWKTAIDRLDPPLKDIFLFLFFSILEETSFTSKDGQFLRLRRKKPLVHPDEALSRRVSQAKVDLEAMRRLFPKESVHLSHTPTSLLADTRDLKDVPFDRQPTAIITSPPYANRYDYTRTYSLELCFHFIKNFEELRDVRLGILRSHIESKVAEGERPPHPVVEEIVQTLRCKQLNNPRIPYMLTAYFIDMQKAIREWGRVLAPGAQVAMVVDNVRFEGEMVPVDLVLSEMAEEAGFQVKEIIVARYKGNSSQQMKKYGRVPVRESIVIWRRRGL